MIERKLFSPIQIGKKISRNRLVMAPMSTNFGTNKGNNFVSDYHIKHYGMRAKYGIGVIIPEGMHVHVGGFDERKSLGLSGDEYIPGLKLLADEVHRYQSLIIGQVALGGKAGGKITLGDREAAVYSSCAMPHRRTGLLPKAMTVGEIADAVRLYGECAVRLQKAGFDGVEVHGAHGYMLMQFVSPFYNHRFDEYGGCLENRIRFPMQIVEEVRNRVGEDFIVGYRMSASETFANGLTIEDSVVFAQKLQEAGVDYIHVSGGSNETPDDQRHSIATLYSPEGYLLQDALKIKEAVSIPVIAVGKLGDPNLAEAAIEKGMADMVALGRPLFADPEWALKAEAGKDQEITKCISCNAGCIEHINAFQPITCMQNPLLGRNLFDDEIPEATGGKKSILVIGAGLAGLEYSIRAAQRGHCVKIWEQADRAGGQALLASRSPHKEVFYELVKSRVSKLEKLGVEIVYNKTCSLAQLQQEKYDCIVCAAGGKPIRLSGSWMNSPLVEDTWKWIMEPKVAASNEKMVIIGGGSIGLETAHQMEALGYNVTVLELQDEAGSGIVPTVRYALMAELQKAGVQIITAASVRGIEENTVLFAQNGKTRRIEGVSVVLPAVGVEPDDHLYQELKKAGFPVIALGNCSHPGNGLDVVSEACAAGLSI